MTNVIKNCLYCNNIFHTNQDQINVGNGKYCSIECKHLSQYQQINIKCDFCEREFNISQYRFNHSKSHFCSRVCKSKYQIGKKKSLSLDDVLSMIDKKSDEECWPWFGSLQNGYGSFYSNGKKNYVHIFMYKTFIGEIPDKMEVCHKCDNPPCANYHHYFLGTRVDNLMDMVSKGRHQRGENHYLSSFIEQDIINIRKLHSNGETQRSIAKKYNVTFQTIWQIVNKKTWKHIE